MVWNTGWVRNALSRFRAAGRRLARADLDLGIGKLAAECAPHRLDGRRRRGLVQRDAERAFADAQIDFFSVRPDDDFALSATRIHRHGVEERLALQCKAELAQVPPPAP